MKAIWSYRGIASRPAIELQPEDITESVALDLWMDLAFWGGGITASCTKIDADDYTTVIVSAKERVLKDTDVQFGNRDD